MNTGFPKPRAADVARQCRGSLRSCACHIDERAVQSNSGLTSPGEIAGLLAREGDLRIGQDLRHHVICRADQTLALKQRLFSKPSGEGAQAAEQLRLLAGNTHALHSAVAVARDGKVVFDDVRVARMTMRNLSEGEISAISMLPAKP